MGIRKIIYVMELRAVVHNKHKKGFTLIEMLLVLVVMSAILVMYIGYMNQKTEQMRLDKTALQIQQILNAGLAYYVNNNVWPVNCTQLGDLSTLQNENYLPSGTINSPYGNPYSLYCSSYTGVFTVSTTVPSDTETQLLLGRVPMSAVTNCASYPGAVCPCLSGTTCLTASVNLPPQVLNNSRSVNFASVYHSGACVPAPTCPLGMTPQILVAPVSVSGLNDLTAAATTPQNAYALTSFTANAYGDNNNNPIQISSSSSTIRSCVDPNVQENCLGSSTNLDICTVNPQQCGTNSYYWRVCLTINTEKGAVPKAPSMNAGYLLGWVLAVTRCSPANEAPMGTPFGIWHW